MLEPQTHEILFYIMHVYWYSPAVCDYMCWICFTVFNPQYEIEFDVLGYISGTYPRIRGVVANYLASQARDPGIDSHQHLKDSWHIWRHLRRDTVFSCNLRCRLIFLHGCSRTYRVASLRAGPVGRISYNLYFDCKHVRSVTCDLINEYTILYYIRLFHCEVDRSRFVLRLIQVN